MDDLVYLISLGNHEELNPRMLDKRMAAANAVADALKPSIAPLVRRILDFASSREDMNSSATKDSKPAAAAAIAAGDLQKGAAIMIGISKRLGKEQ